MLYRTILLAFAFAACQATGQQDEIDSPNEPALEPSMSVELTVTLTDATQAPMPTGLPTRLAISGPRAPQPGGQADVTWEALDGDPAREPRAGSGWIERSSDLAQVTIWLSFEEATEDGAAIMLTGTLSGMEISGTFSDRLFYTRNGLFVGTFQES